MKTMQQAIFDAGMVEQLAVKKDAAAMRRRWKSPQKFTFPPIVFDGTPMSEQTREYVRRFDEANRLVHIVVEFCDPCDLGDDDATTSAGSVYFEPQFIAHAGG